MERLKHGTEDTLIYLKCPHCNSEEYFPSYIQPDQFECLHVSPKGKIRAWHCSSCKRRFYTENAT